MPAGRPRQPIDLIEVKGKKHLTKSEIKQRREMEIQINSNKVLPPEYLNAEQQKKFIHIANILLDVGIMTELDEENLAQYLIANTNYVLYTKKVNKLNKKLEKETDSKKEYELMVLLEPLLKQQDKALSQSRACASDMGLTISSRCKLVAPKPKEQPKENKFKKFE